MTADYYENGQVVMRLFSLISAKWKGFGGSSLRAPMRGCISHTSRVLSSSNAMVARQRIARQFDEFVSDIPN